MVRDDRPESPGSWTASRLRSAWSYWEPRTWVAAHGSVTRGADAVIADVWGWNASKRSQTKEGYIQVALDGLREQNWVVAQS